MTATRAASAKYAEAKADFTVTFTTKSTTTAFSVIAPTPVTWGTNSAAPTVTGTNAKTGAVTYAKKNRRKKYCRFYIC